MGGDRNQRGGVHQSVGTAVSTGTVSGTVLTRGGLYNERM